MSKRERIDPASRSALIVLNFALAMAVLGLFLRSKPAWVEVQDAYIDQVPEFKPGLLTVTGDAMGQRELCPACHPAAAGHPSVEGSIAFGPHPDVYHEPTVLGCVGCHGGDPESVLPHQHGRYGLDAPLAPGQAWVSCLHCHSPADDGPAFEAYPATVRAHERISAVVMENGCLGCHRIYGRGGILGPDLSDLGTKRMTDPHQPLATVQGRVATKLSAEPVGVSLMPRFLIDEADRALLVPWLTTAGRHNMGDEDRWVPGHDARLATGEGLFAAFCSGCHGDKGQGREPGNIPGGVPTIGSQLFGLAAGPDHIERVVSNGRPGTLMLGFNAPPESGSEPILEEDEIQLLVDLLTSGSLAEDPDGVFEAVAVASCEACHPGRPELFSELSDEERVTGLREHSRDLDLAGFAAAEGVPWPPSGEQRDLARSTFFDLCTRCHADPERGSGIEGDRELPGPASPRIRGYAADESFTDGFVFLTLVLGRGDAEPSKWRHEGVLKGQFTLEQMLALIQFARTEP